jgi:hypothetical protein
VWLLRLMDLDANGAVNFNEFVESYRRHDRVSTQADSERWSEGVWLLRLMDLDAMSLSRATDSASGIGTAARLCVTEWE